MYQIIFSFVFCFFALVQAVSQEPVRSDRRVVVRSRGYGEQVQVERIAYFTEKIGLTSAEAQLFWPIYNEMDKKRTALFEERASIMQKFMKDADKLNDKQINEQLNRLVTIQQQETALPAEYDAQFRKVLPSRKVMNLYVAEMEFRNYLLQKMRERRPER
jgi:Spy/CpxP family protein refolding chaperone